MRIGFNFQKGSRIRGTVTQGLKNSTMSVEIWGAAHRSLAAIAGRMARFDVPVPGGIEQPNGDYVLDLLAKKDARTITFTDENGAAGAVTISAREQRDGWGEGDYYMLEVDADGWLITEEGYNHRKVHVTKGAHGYTRAEIAAEAGVTEATVTNAWLEGRPEYGTTAKPFEESVGTSFWSSITHYSRGATSHWLLFERGYTYDANFSMPDGIRGESPLHPLVVGAWGTGDAPKGIVKESNGIAWANIVFRDLDESHMSARSGIYLLTSNLKSNQATTLCGDAQATNKGVDFATMHRCWVHNVVRDAPRNGVSWEAHPDHIGSTFAAGFHGYCLIETGGYHVGWGEGYHPEGLWNNGQYPMPPSMYSHNYYFQDTCRDVDIDAGWTISPGSMGWMLRPGGRVRNTAMADAGVQMNELGRNYMSRGPVGNYALLLGNSGTEAAYHAGVTSIGALNYGFDIAGRQACLVDNAVFHMANPDDAADVARKTNKWHAAANAANALYNNTLHFKWSRNGDNIGSLSAAALNIITLQRFAKEEMGSAVNVSVREFGAWLTARTAKERTESLWRWHDYWRAAYGSEFDVLPAVRRTANTTLHFSPDPRGEGFLNANELNWSTGDLPLNGDTIRLDGNRMKWAKYTNTVANFGFDGGLLEVTSGKLTIQALNDRAKTFTAGSGQLVVPAGTGDHVARSGRLSFTGAHAGGLEISGDAQVALGPNFTVEAGKSLRVEGGQIRGVGWTGSGSATFTQNGTLDIRSTLILNANSFLYRYRRGIKLKGATSGFTAILDKQTKIHSSSGNWTTAIRDLVGMPVVGEDIISPDANGEHVFPNGVNVIPSVYTIGAATLPKIGKFKRRGGEADPTVNVTYVINGPLKLNLTGVVAGTYPLIEANSITGNFTSQEITGVGAGLTATVNKTSTKVEVMVAAA